MDNKGDFIAPFRTWVEAWFKRPGLANTHPSYSHADWQALDACPQVIHLFIIEWILHSIPPMSLCSPFSICEQLR